MNNNFIKKNILITGSSSGIGFGLAKKYLNQGHKVIICSKNIKKLKLASKILNNCFYVQADLSKETEIKKAIQKIKAKSIKLDILICNYGNSNFKKNNLDFYHAFNNNFFSSVNTIKHVLPVLKKNTGKIICISSICAIEAIKGAPIAYSVAKSALNNYVKSISFILAKEKICINSIAPGNIYFKGSTWEKKMKTNKSKIRKYIYEHVPMNKFGDIQDIFNLCTYLCTDNHFTTGSTYIIDGGQTKAFS